MTRIDTNQLWFKGQLWFMVHGELLKVIFNLDVELDGNDNLNKDDDK